MKKNLVPGRIGFRLLRADVMPIFSAFLWGELGAILFVSYTLFWKKKSKINSQISVLFSFVWITFDFFCFFSSDIDSLLWTKHSSILSPEVSSVEEIEPVEGMQNNLRLLIEQLSSSCLLLYLLKQMIVIRTEKPPKRRSTMAPKECTFLNARQIINTNECSATNQPVGMLLFSWFNFIIMSHTWSCLIVSSILSTFIFTSFCFCPWLGIISIGYCWCANDETGKPIPGTSVQNSKPTNCDNLPAHVLNRPTPPPVPKENLKPVYRPLTAEEGNFE